MRPGPSVILYAIALRIRGIVGYLLAAVEFALGGVDGINVGLASLLVLELIPHSRVNAKTKQPSIGGENDISFLIIPGVLLVLLKDGEL